MNYLKTKVDLKKVYDQLAENWGKDKNIVEWGQEELNEFASLVDKGGRILDLGCGAGIQSKQLTELGFKVIGLDLSLGMVQVARINSPRSKFMVGDMEKLDFKPGYFEGVYARASLLHIKKANTLKVLRSANQIMTKGGVLYLALKEGRGEKLVENVKYGKKVKRFFSFFRLLELKKLLKESGFTILRSHKWSKDKTVWLHIFARKI